MLDCVTKDKTESRVLLAEDNLVNQQVTYAMLERLGCTVVIATDGREVFEALQQTDYDLILMDCQMPVVDGYTAATEIRRQEQEVGVESRIPIIAVTANMEEENRLRCFTAGMDDFLGKPFSMVLLKKILYRWLPPEKAIDAKLTILPEDISELSSPIPQGLANAALDKAALDNIRQLQQPGQPDLLGKVIEIYLQDVPSMITTLYRAVEQRDAETVRREAHRLKSCSANLGATSMAASGRKLEEMGRNCELGDAIGVLGSLEREFSLVQRALMQESGVG